MGTPLGYVLKWMYDFLGSYGWSIIVFTIVVRLASFPLQIKQQKSTARMSAYQPMMQEIQKKYAKDKEKQNEELMKMQQEYGYNPTAGCLPMILNMLVMFGVIEAVYYPLRHILHIGKDILEPIAKSMSMNYDFSFESKLIQLVQSGQLTQLEGVSAEQFSSIQNFNTMFLGGLIDLSQIPTLAFSALLIFPLLSVVTMAAQNVVTMRSTGQEMTGSMKWMPWVMSLMFVSFSFRMPVAFSLYYTISNLLMLIQSIVLRKMYNPDKLKLEIAAEIEEKKKAAKAKKQVVVVDESGQEVVKDVNQAELNRLRLERARQRSLEKYSDERTTPLTGEEE